LSAEHPPTDLAMLALVRLEGIADRAIRRLGLGLERKRELARPTLAQYPATRQPEPADADIASATNKRREAGMTTAVARRAKSHAAPPAPTITLAEAMRDPQLLGAPFTASSFWTWYAVAKVLSGDKLDAREAELFRQCTGRYVFRMVRCAA
jgi:hypothetical protein